MARPKVLNLPNGTITLQGFSTEESNQLTTYIKGFLPETTANPILIKDTKIESVTDAVPAKDYTVGITHDSLAGYAVVEVCYVESRVLSTHPNKVSAQQALKFELYKLGLV